MGEWESLRVYSYVHWHVIHIYKSAQWNQAKEKTSYNIDAVNVYICKILSKFALIRFQSDIVYSIYNGITKFIPLAWKLH